MRHKVKFTYHYSQRKTPVIFSGVFFHVQFCSV